MNPNNRPPRESTAVLLCQIQASLAAQDAQLSRLESRAALTEQSIQHVEELLAARLERQEQDQADQESRLRTLSADVIALKAVMRLAQLAQATLTLLVSGLAAWLGQR